MSQLFSILSAPGPAPVMPSMVVNDPGEDTAAATSAAGHEAPPGTAGRPAAPSLFPPSAAPFAEVLERMRGAMSAGKRQVLAATGRDGTADTTADTSPATSPAEAGPAGLVAIPLSPALAVITLAGDERPGDDDLARFARSQGFDDSAVKAIFGAAPPTLVASPAVHPLTSLPAIPPPAPTAAATPGPTVAATAGGTDEGGPLAARPRPGHRAVAPGLTPSSTAMPLTTPDAGPALHPDTRAWAATAAPRPALPAADATTAPRPDPVRLGVKPWPGAATASPIALAAAAVRPATPAASPVSTPSAILGTPIAQADRATMPSPAPVDLPPAAHGPIAVPAAAGGSAAGAQDVVASEPLQPAPVRREPPPPPPPTPPGGEWLGGRPNVLDAPAGSVAPPVEAGALPAVAGASSGEGAPPSGQERDPPPAYEPLPGASPGPEARAEPAFGLSRPQTDRVADATSGQAALAGELLRLDPGVNEPLERQAQRLGEAMGHRLAAQIGRGQWEMRLSLTPQNLGHIDVQLKVQDQAIDARFQVSNSHTQGLLQDGMPRLKEVLNMSGMEIAAYVVTGGGAERNRGNPTPWKQSPQRDTNRHLHVETRSADTGLARAGARSRDDGGSLDVLV